MLRGCEVPLRCAGQRGRTMERLNLLAGWIGIAAGFVAGAVAGMLFDREDWLGGYASWRRRMLRLGHIAFFGIGLINLAFALSVPVLPGGDRLKLTGWLLIAGAVGMPLCCYLSAWRKAFRHLFFLPVTSLLVAVGWLLIKGFAR